MSEQSTISPPRRLDRLYGLVAGDEDARACREISEEACHELPGNFARLIIISTLTKLGDELSSAKTVLAWLIESAGAPLFLVGLLVPIRESGSMIPQLLIGGWVRGIEVRKWVWVSGSLIQALALLGMGLAAAMLHGAVAGWSIVAFLALFSVARGLCSIAGKDVLGKTVPKRRRGRLTGLSASLSGLLAVGAGAVILAGGEAVSSPWFYAGLLLVAAALWLVAAGIFTAIKEEPGATEGGANGFRRAMQRLDLLRTDAAFRRFVVARALLLCSALMAPYFVVLARENAGKAASLGLFVLAGALASSLSATVWGFLADLSSKRVLVCAAAMAALLGVVVFVLATYLPALGRRPWVYPAAFFVLGVAHSGVRAGRKTYIVDMAAGNQRTDYVAVSNTVIGVLLLATGLLGALSAVLSAAGMILLLSLFGLAGVAMASSLPEVE